MTANFKYYFSSGVILWENVEIDENIVVSETKKGQATIPKKLRQKCSIKDKAIIVEDQKGIFLKPLSSPVEAFGSLKHLYPGITAREVIGEGRKEDCEREKRLMKMLEYLTFDSEPIVAFFFGEPGARLVINLLEKTQAKDIETYINIFN